MQNVVSKTLSVFIFSPDPVLQTIRSFGHLPRGWHYGEGVPADPDAIARATVSIGRFKALGAESFEVFPGLDGGVLVSAYRGSLCVDLVIHPEDRVSLLVDDEGVETFEKEDLTLFEALRTVGEKKWLSDQSSASPTQSTTAINSINLSPLHSANQVMTNVYLSSFNVAWTTMVSRYATTSGNTTLQLSVVIPQYSFDSPTLNYPDNALSLYNKIPIPKISATTWLPA